MCYLDTKQAKKYFLVLVAFIVAVYIGNAIYSKYIKENYIIALNSTTSLDGYFYIINKKIEPTSFKKGNIIAFKFTKDSDEYYSLNHNFIKQITCSQGSVLSIKNGSTYFCDGKIIGVAKPTDSNGKLVSNFKFNGVIPKDNYFVMGTAQSSYDSRYWGFVNKKDIIGVASW